MSGRLKIHFAMAVYRVLLRFPWVHQKWALRASILHQIGLKKAEKLFKTSRPPGDARLTLDEISFIAACEVSKVPILVKSFRKTFDISDRIAGFQNLRSRRWAHIGFIYGKYGTGLGWNFYKDESLPAEFECVEVEVVKQLDAYVLVLFRVRVRPSFSEQLHRIQAGRFLPRLKFKPKKLLSSFMLWGYSQQSNQFAQSEAISEAIIGLRESVIRYLRSRFKWIGSDSALNFIEFWSLRDLTLEAEKGLVQVL
jgi:hypothetical protein